MLSQEVTVTDQSTFVTGWKAGVMQYADLNGDREIDFGNNTVVDPPGLEPGLF